MTDKDNRKWCIRLADGRSWEMVAGHHAQEWLEKSAFILGLERSDQPCQSRMAFLRRRTLCESPPGSAESQVKAAINEWEVEWLQKALFYFRKDRSFFDCELMTGEGTGEDVLGLSLALYPIYQQIQASGGLLLHAALVERDGQGIVIAGSSGTGKSTCCKRIPSPWQPLCDDEVLVVCGEDGRYFAHPFPTWSEYYRGESNRSWNVQRYVPLKAIFQLKQSGYDKVNHLSQSETALTFYRSTAEANQRFLFRLEANKELISKRMLFENACDMARLVPGYLLEATLSGRFWEQIECALRE